MKILAPNKIAECLYNGEVIIIPTETVYGIACDARNNEAVKKIYQIKGRNFDKPLQVMVSRLETAENFLEFDERAKEYAKKYLPGALTMVLKKKENSNLSPFLNNNNDTLGLRIPNHKTLLEMLDLIDFPIAATSANLSGGKDNTSCEEAMEALKDTEIQNALDGGKCIFSKPSTVADFTSKEIRIIRQGDLVI
ncbi:MAG: L-threonylcarbamoyladenylate synthase [Rickettsiales bacterium]|nr:L-threonylcarbamoyladenylate synthase [Rickettsiales bacterium]